MKNTGVRPNTARNWYEINYLVRLNACFEHPSDGSVTVSVELPEIRNRIVRNTALIDLAGHVSEALTHLATGPLDLNFLAFHIIGIIGIVGITWVINRLIIPWVHVGDKLTIFPRAIAVFGATRLHSRSTAIAIASTEDKKVSRSTANDGA